MRNDRPIFPILFVLICLFVGVKSNGQNAYYHFNNADANDYAGSYHATTTTDISYVTGAKDYADVKDTTGKIILPSALSDSLFAQNSLDISFDIKFTAGQPICIMTDQSPISSAFWQNPGFTIYATIGTSANLILAYADSTANGSGSINNLTLDQWHSVSVSMDLNANYWKIIVDSTSKIGTFFNGFNTNEFRNAVKTGTFTIGGYGGNKPFPWYGQIGIDELKFTFPSSASSNDVRSAYHWLYQDLIGAVSLSEAQKQAYNSTIQLGLPFSNYQQVKDSLFAYTAKYEELNPPLFTPNTSSHILEDSMAVHDQVVLFSQGHVFDTEFNSTNMDSIHGVKFEFGDLFPGSVADTAPRTIGGVVEVNGTYNIDIAAAYGMQEFVVRPTGYYLAAGDTVTIEVPLACVNKGLSVVAGVHFRNLNPGAINRPRDISLEYPITSLKTKIANPYGGGIYIKVPDGSNLGWFNVTVNHAVKAPYFSWRAGKHTNVATWLTDIQNTNAPWADFESDKYMFTIPISNASKALAPDKIMARWDSIMDAFRFAGGRPIDTRIRAEFYTADRKLVTPAYGSGYPTVITIPELNHINSNWDPVNVLLDIPSPILSHEMGHTAMHPTMEYDSAHPCEFEAETIVHVPMAYFNETVYKMSPDSAFAHSGVTNQVNNFDQGAFDWIITDNFRNNIPMSYDTSAPMVDKEQLKYQHRGWAKYLDLARAYSWDTVSQVFGKYYTAGVAQNSTVTCNPAFQSIAGRDEFIQYSCDVTGENVAPLFHFWGVNPTDSLATLLSPLPKSQRVKELIDHYFCKVAPQSLADYTTYHNAMFARLGYQQTRYTKYLSEFDATYVSKINAQFALILNKYGLYGPTSPTTLTINASGNTAMLSWTDNASSETGFVIRQKITGTSEYTIMATVGANVTSYTTPVLPLGSYDFMVTSINVENLESNHCEAITGTILLSSCTTQDSISVNACNNYLTPSGLTLTSSGIFKDTLVGAGQFGCDSIITINLTISPIIYDTTYVGICDSLISPSGKYIWKTTGIYADTIANGIGCDSFFVVHLTIAPTINSSINETACGSYNSPSGKYIWNTTGIYKDTLQAANGCSDSIITVNLTVNPYLYDTTYVNMCDSLVSPSGKYVWKASGQYADTVLNILGCDTFVTIFLTIAPSINTNLNATSCGSYNSPSGKFFWNTTGIYKDTLQASNGCSDSIITVNLTINPYVYDTTYATVCDSLISPSGKYVWNVSGTYADTLISAIGCDTYSTIFLTVMSPNLVSINATTCGGYTSPSGKYTWNTTGIYLDTISGLNSCSDSIFTINLTINPYVYDTTYVNMCDSLVSPSGKYIWTASGTYSDTVVNATGCDTYSTIFLTITSPSMGSINETTCGSYTSPSGKYTWNMSGIYEDTLQVLNGCADSIITINLTISSYLYDTTYITACDSLVSPSGKYVWNVSGQYADTLINAVGCDTYSTIFLTIAASVTSNMNETSCGSYTSPSGKYNWDTSGVYVDTIPTINGCSDSIITINLNVLQDQYSTIFDTACVDYESPSEAYVWTTSGIYLDTLEASNGCTDSIITIHLEIVNEFNRVEYDTACSFYITVEGDTLFDSEIYSDTLLSQRGCDSIVVRNIVIGEEHRDTIFEDGCDEFESDQGTIWTASGLYSDTLIGQYGCDSIETIDLIIFNSNLVFVSDTVCDAYTSANGNIYTQSGIYFDTLDNIMGCDSVIELNLTIPVNQISISWDVLSASLVASTDSMASYQWVDCDNNNEPITGATNSSFIPESSGNYAVEVLMDNCSLISNCENVIIGNIASKMDLLGFKIVPNPTESDVRVQLSGDKQYANLKVRVFNVLGEELMQVPTVHSNFLQITLPPISGLYFLQIEAENELLGIGKVIKE